MTPETDAPVIVFEGVDLAFDEKVILKNLSFTIRQGHTKIFLGASGAGKSTILKLILGLLKPRSPAPSGSRASASISSARPR